MGRISRMTAREIAVQIIFAASAVNEDFAVYARNFLTEENFESLGGELEIYREFPDDNNLSYIIGVCGLLSDNISEVDRTIESNMVGWSKNRISGTALAVLRCAVTEILYMEDIPSSVSANSAVEIAKKYDEQSVVSFVNGSLGNVIKGQSKADDE